MTDANHPQSIPLWADAAPGALSTRDEDVPTLTPFLPTSRPANPTAARPAIVVCPGGGYGHLAGHEGETYAQWLNILGIAAFVLKYRLGTDGYRHPTMLHDAARAVRLTRSMASKWNIDPRRVGIMGSSAGGHLASTLLTHSDAGDARSPDPIDHHSSRPDVGILCYPVITMGAHSHSGSRASLLGEQPSAELVTLLSNELQVTTDTPPCFVWHTWEDAAVPVENSMDFAAALRRAGVPFDLHIYQKGRHGIGLSDKPPFANVHPWARDLAFWLKANNFTTN
ncbi:MAG TPA: alpha/beta hydrolase [Tepidisphaeraceae bacterium]|jgi:acetyl esterase/lipase|nr:alpha/beta hydrolase [Tepidisphaeraceae bacterium]